MCCILYIMVFENVVKIIYLYFDEKHVDHSFPINPDREGRLRTSLYDKGDDFNFPIVFFPFIYSNIPAAPAYAVYISQLWSPP